MCGFTVEWESQLFRGTMRARCYPFNLPKRRFHSFNPKVRTCIHMMHIIGTCQYILSHTDMYLVCTGTYPVFETVWGDFRQSRRLLRGRILPANRQTSVGRRLVRVASVMVPEWKCSVECDLCEYVLIQHWYILVCTGINKAFLKIWKQTFCFTLNYSWWYLECGTSIWWYPSMIIVPPSP